MDNIKLKGYELISIGIITIIWTILKITSSIIIATYISTLLNLTSFTWMAGSIIIFTILTKILFHNNNFQTYTLLVDDYKKEISDKDCECEKRDTTINNDIVGDDDIA